MTRRMRFYPELQAFADHSDSVLKGEALARLQRVSRGKSHYSETSITAEAKAVYLTVILSRERTLMVQLSKRVVM